MNLTRRNILFFLFYVSFCSAAENKPFASNREVFFIVSDSMINKIAAQQLQQYSLITIKTNNDTFTNYFRQHFIKSLISNNKTVFENSETASEATLELSVQESSVFFGDVFTESFLGKKKVERSIRLSLIATLTSLSNGKILFSKQISESVVDTVNYADIEKMNNASLPMTNFQRPELSFFDSFLEPAIVIFSTGVAVYLFFTIRS